MDELCGHSRMEPILERLTPQSDPISLYIYTCAHTLRHPEYVQYVPLQPGFLADVQRELSDGVLYCQRIMVSHLQLEPPTVSAEGCLVTDAYKRN